MLLGQCSGRRAYGAMVGAGPGPGRRGAGGLRHGLRAWLRALPAGSRGLHSDVRLRGRRRAVNNKHKSIAWGKHA